MDILTALSVGALALTVLGNLHSPFTFASPPQQPTYALPICSPLPYPLSHLYTDHSKITPPFRSRQPAKIESHFVFPSPRQRVEHEANRSHGQKRKYRPKPQTLPALSISATPVVPAFHRHHARVSIYYLRTHPFSSPYPA